MLMPATSAAACRKDELRSQLTEWHKLLGDFYDHIQAQFGKKKTKGRETVSYHHVKKHATNCLLTAKRLQAFYPLLTGLLCAGEAKDFYSNAPDLRELLFRALKACILPFLYNCPAESWTISPHSYHWGLQDSRLRGVALECIYNLLVAQLKAKGSSDKDFGDECVALADRLFGVFDHSSGAPSTKKKDKQIILSIGEESIETVADLISLISLAKFDLATHSIVLELLKDKSPEYVLSPFPS